MDKNRDKRSQGDGMMGSDAVESDRSMRGSERSESTERSSTGDRNDRSGRDRSANTDRSVSTDRSASGRDAAEGDRERESREAAEGAVSQPDGATDVSDVDRATQRLAGSKQVGVGSAVHNDSRTPSIRTSDRPSDV